MAFGSKARAAAMQAKSRAASPRLEDDGNVAPMQPVRVSELYVYPVKGARGLRVREAALTPRGLCHDRRFMIIDEAGTFISQRTIPKLALLRTRIEGDALVLEADEIGAISVPLAPRAGDPRRARVWADTCEAISLGAPARSFLERALGVPAELVYMPDQTRRQVDRAYAPEGAIVGFADGFPSLLISHASLVALNERLAERVPMNRFRPNLVVEGCGPFAEDDFAPFSLGGARFTRAKPCARCQVVNVDQATGAKGKEPLATLARFRNQGNKVLFGQNLIHEGAGTIREGDTLVFDA